MKIGNHEFDIENQTYIMGILNVTPDSFSDGGKWNSLDQALLHVKEMIEEGATIIDVGGESTRPGYTMISEEKEIARVVPIIRAIKEQYNIPVSIDTYKSSVAKAAVDAGADLINDIWGLKYDPQMASVIAETKVSCCLMHNRKEEELDYGHTRDTFMDAMCADLEETLRIAKEAGIEKDKIILDPGVGFAKTYQQNLWAIKEVGRLKALGCPVLLGTSRKSVIGLSLDLPKEERVEGTIVTSVYGVQNGCAFVRVHDVKQNFRAIQMTKAIEGTL